MDNYYNYPYTYTTSTNINEKPICFGFSGGAEGILGKSKVIKHLLGLNLDYTNSYYNHYVRASTYNHMGGTSYLGNINVKRSVAFLVGSYGTKFQIKSFNIGAFACYNYFLSKKETQNGYVKDSNSIIYPDSITIKDKKISSFNDTNFISLKLRVGYDFKIGSNNMSIFLMRNFNVINILTPEHSYYAPWWYLGIQYIPNLGRMKTN